MGRSHKLYSSSCLPSPSGESKAPHGSFDEFNYYSDDYADYSADVNDDFLNENEKVVHTIPEFVTPATSQTVNEGDIIKLPCYVDKIGETDES